MVANKWLMLGCASLALISSPALAQAPAANDEVARTDGPITQAADIVVIAGIGYRDRTDTPEPVLKYGTEYFQRFEPLTAGDALKRVPSVTFLSDVLESDAPQMRGLPPGYTQILINGERVPGSSADRSFFMDRIPAELIDSVEIVRSSSARRTGDAIAGTLNINLRDGYELNGGYVRAGGLLYDDNELEPSLGFVWGGAVGPGRLLLGGNLQGRHNPKQKKSLRYGDSPENNADYATDDFDNREDQRDTRDGKDYSFNGSYEIDAGDTNFKLNGFYVKTDRTENERSFEYDDATAVTGPVPDGNLLSDNANVAKIDQENFSIDGKLTQDWAAGKTSLRVGYAKFVEDRTETEYEIGFDVDDGDDPEFEGALTQTDIKDQEFSVKLEHEVPLGETMKFVFGGFYQDKTRRTGIFEAEQEGTGSFDWDQFSQNPTDLAGDFEDLEATDGGDSRIREKRRDAFALVEGDTGSFKWEAGLRYEHTKVRVTDYTVDDDIANQSNSYGKFLPSASFKLSLTDKDRIIGSVARTLRRPQFDYILPATLEEEVGDSDLLGNPQLDPESAWGFDIGYEHRMGSRGIVGVNFFYRDVTDLIELTNTGEEGSEGAGTFIYTPMNVGDGKVYGIEFDLSTDLGFIGLPNTGLFGNASWLDSEITDELGKRRFNNQSKYVYNFGFIQDFPTFGAAFGATYRKQGAAYSRVISEEVTTTYGAELEVFVEKRFGKKFTIRAVGSNLLNGAKRETFNKFDNLADQLDRDFDEYELESEKAGPVFQIMARMAF
ncbi:MAG TPA: TonB-dependent receptor [Sphingobium sp.]|uniref:TonB-dependent receptor plug domain-containing protein n=1 Tax=unclassified Sphingobium TaxID=2611147 RepID=UPI0007F53C57|nr:MULTISPECIES: TonB-dependent receptor [unclassified Sphingobium]OAN51821.1 TonB-dependent receptor [Sphingobium sp. TCM1]HAF41368.1 TonB-dependent receptor [Sphingobium sp.]